MSAGSGTPLLTRPSVVPLVLGAAYVGQVRCTRLSGGRVDRRRTRSLRWTLPALVLTDVCGLDVIRRWCLGR